MKTHDTNHYTRPCKPTRAVFSVLKVMLMTVLLAGVFSMESQAQTQEVHDRIINKLNKLLYKPHVNQDELIARLDRLETRLNDVVSLVTPSRFNVNAQVCLDVVLLQGELSGAVKGSADAGARATAGLDAVGNRLEVNTKPEFETEFGGEVSTSVGVEVVFCFNWEGEGFGGPPGSSTSQAIAKSSYQTQDLEALGEALEASTLLFEDRLVDLADKLQIGPQDLAEKTDRALSLVSDFEMPTSPFALFDGTFKDQLIGLAELAPVGNDFKVLLQNPTSLFPTNLNQMDLCHDDFMSQLPNVTIPTEFRDRIAFLCDPIPIPLSEVPEVVANLLNLPEKLTAVQGVVDNVQIAVGNVQGTVGNVQTAVGNVQGTVNSVHGTVATINNRVLNINNKINLIYCWVFRCINLPTANHRSETATPFQQVQPGELVSKTVTAPEQLAEAVPTDYALETNYPNPFNPTTTIRFDLPEANHVTLKVYNMAGREIGTLVSDNLSAGKHRVIWNAGSLASGTYLYRLTAGSFVESKSMILLK